MHRKELTAVLIVVIGVAIFLVYTAAGAIGQILTFNSSVPSTATVVDMSGWQTYKNSTYGFSVNYPQDWQVSTDGLTASVPFVAIGDPLQGTSTYVIGIFIESNPAGLSSGAYAHQVVNDARTTDATNAKNGPAPQTAPQFTKSFVTTAGNNEGYELFRVFEFDHNAERIYVAHGTSTLRFDFPVAEENPNLSLPVKNNAIAHQIIGTLMLE